MSPRKIISIRAAQSVAASLEGRLSSLEVHKKVLTYLILTSRDVRLRHLPADSLASRFAQWIPERATWTFNDSRLATWDLHTLFPWAGMFKSWRVGYIFTFQPSPYPFLRNLVLRQYNRNKSDYTHTIVGVSALLLRATYMVSFYGDGVYTGIHVHKWVKYKYRSAQGSAWLSE